jgi:16S rRNA (cytidine1402-2'-O)-methyltransferase
VLAISRELTKLYEESFVGTAAEALDYFTEPRGEFVLVIEGAGSKLDAPVEKADLLADVQQMRDLGLTRAQATALLQSRHGISRRRAYELWLASEREG